MSDFITLSCPNCGGNLALTPDTERFACPYCKREHLVRRSEGHISVVPIIEQLERITQGVDRHASELAIQRLRDDRRALEERIKRQQDQVERRSQRWVEVKADLRGGRIRSIVATVFGWGAGCLALGCFIAGGDGSACLGVFLSRVSVGSGLVATITHVGFARRTVRLDDAWQRMDESQRFLKELRVELNRVYAELEHHSQVVRRS